LLQVTGIRLGRCKAGAGREASCADLRGVQRNLSHGCVAVKYSMYKPFLRLCKSQ
jgi:hypothetical protein